MRSLKRTSLLLIFVLLLTGCPKGDLSKRVLKAALKIPEVVRVVAPNANPTVFRLLEKSRDAFQSVVNNPTRSAWEHAINIWNSEVRGELLALNKPALTAVVVALDLLLPDLSGMAAMPADGLYKPDFDKGKVEDFEQKVNEALKSK